MFCVQCGSKLERTWGHCSNCGAKIEQFQSPSISVTENLFRPGSPKFKLGCGGIVLVLIAAGLISSAFSPRQNDASEPSESPSIIEREAITLEQAVKRTMSGDTTVEELARINCQLFSGYTTEYFERLSKEVPRATPEYKKIKAPRQALAFIQENNLQTYNLLADYEKGFKDGIAEILKLVEDRINFQFFVKSGENWEDAMGNAVLKECQSMSQYQTTLENVILPQQKEIDRVQNLAKNVPWYPDGFEQLSLNANFAYQTGIGGYCRLGDSCARFKIVGKIACQSLYLKVNFLNSAGEIVDWGNELITLPANQVAIIDIGTFSRISKWRLEELSCY